jgi:drug/metabolite transporter (DMT)-like permease
MPGRSSDSNALQYVGAVVALVAVVGYAFFGWQFGETNSITPLAIGVVCAVAAVSWTLYSRWN